MAEQGDSLVDVDLAPSAVEPEKDSAPLLDASAQAVESAFTRSAKVVLLLTAFVDILGFSMPNPIMPYYFSQIPGFTPQNQGLYFGLIMSSFSVGQFFGSLVVGMASDRFGRRWPILACLLGNSAFLVYTGFAPTLAQLIVARGCAGLFAGTQSVCSAYVADLTTEDRRRTELAHLSAAVSVGFVAGPAIGIAIGMGFGIPRVQMAFRVTCLAAAVVAGGAFIAGLFFLRETGPSSSASETRKPNVFASGVWRVVAGLLVKRNLLLVLLATLLTQFAGTAMEAALPLLLVGEQGLEIWQVLAVFATLALFVPVVVGLVYPMLSEAAGQKTAMVAGMVVYGLGLAVVPVVLLWYLQVPLALLLAFGNLSDPALQLVASYAAGRAFGTTMGMMRAVGSFARIFGPFAAGALYDVDFGSFLGRHRLLPFWAAAGTSLLTCGVVLLMTNIEGKGQTKEVEQ
jgi:DHA1 family tetracycline resistance protein-like MFS transporter